MHNFTRYLKSICFFLFFFSGVSLYSKSYPEIFKLAQNDARFRQLKQEISLNREREARRQTYLPLQFYYFCGKTSSLWQLAARLDLPYETIATLNQWEHFSTFYTASCILLPNSPGIAVWKKKQKEAWTEKLLRNRQASRAQKVMIDENEILFFVGSRFSTQERREFLAAPFLRPIDGELIITSHYGMRPDPFKKGKNELHLGLDLRAHYASKVYAVADARVLLVARDKVYGLYIILKHSHGLSTLYGHLSKTFVTEDENIKKGSLIALSGASGRVTAAHLHFSVYDHGNSIDPSPYLGLTAWSDDIFVQGTRGN